jgi:hypothetical protein
MVLPIARARGNSRTDEKSRALAPRARPRQSDDRELPSAGVRLLSFTLSLSVSYRKNEKVRFACSCARIHPRFVHTGRRSRSIHFISFHFIPTAFFAPGYACPGVRARTSARTRHFGDAESDEWRRRVWDRRECARFDWTRRDPDGWMDGWIPIRAATATVSFG